MGKIGAWQPIKRILLPPLTRHHYNPVNIQCAYVTPYQSPRSHQTKALIESIHHHQITTISCLQGGINGTPCMVCELRKGNPPPSPKQWDAMRLNEVGPDYIRKVQEMYLGATTRVKTFWETTDRFSVKVGIHQGFIFCLVIGWPADKDEEQITLPK